MSRSLVGRGLVAALCLLTVGSARAADQITLKLGYGQPTTSPRHQAAEKFAAWVAEQTGGRVKVRLFPNETLGPDKQMTEMVAAGTLDMTIASAGVVASYASRLAVFELPFLFASMDRVAAVLDGPVGDELAKDLPAKGLRLLGYWDNGFRQVTNGKRAIERPEDLKGLKLRTPDNRMTLDIFTTLGASPAPLAFPELYLALAQGMFDGQENPIVNIHSAKFYEVQRFLSITNHKYESTPLLVSERTWQKLPADVQRVLKEGGIRFAAEHRRLNQQNEAKDLAELQAKGMKVNRPDLKPFREATKGIYAKWTPVLGEDLVKKVAAAAQ
jgi:tripartite ATP-independent transporter DctP family solute receptor